MDHMLHITYIVFIFYYTIVLFTLHVQLCGYGLNITRTARDVIDIMLY